MAKAKALSNRQRKLRSKASPKASRQGSLDLVPVARPPSGMAARLATLDHVEAEERRRAALAVRADAVGADGPVDPRADVAMEFVVQVVADQTETGRMVKMERGRVGVVSALRARSRDGLAVLHDTGSLTALQVRAGLAFRLCYENVHAGLKSCLGNAGEGSGRQVHDMGELTARSPQAIYRTYVLARLNQMERAVAACAVSGRELQAVRSIAGEGKTIRELVGSNSRARAAYKDALARALDAIAEALRIGGH